MDGLSPRRRSVFWPVAGILVGVQVVTGVLAVALVVWFAYDNSLDLVGNSLRLRLDGLAEEVEQRADLTTTTLRALPINLQVDLGARFPDPVILLEADGTVIETIAPDPSIFPAAPAAIPRFPPPANLDALLQSGDIVMELKGEGEAGTWGVAPVYDAYGFLAGGLLIQPLDASIARELTGTRAGVQRALGVVAVLGGLIAVVLGAFFTGRLVQPLRRITRQVERIGAGEYEARLESRGRDEFGRLTVAINQMAEAVEGSIDRLRKTDQLRRELVANIGHDLRTPLAALMGYLEEAERHLGHENTTSAHEALATAERQAHYLSQLVADLFELSVLDNATAPLRREPIPLAELLHDAARGHRASFAAKDISFETSLAPDLPMIEGDGVRLLRVLDNLLANAQRHTPEGGQVHLHATHAAEEVTIRVQDTGAGMSAETLAHIFDRYYRGSDARTRKGSGTGLGLPISRAIARAHGGDLVAESTIGTGSVFILRLPLHEAPNQ